MLRDTVLPSPFIQQLFALVAQRASPDLGSSVVSPPRPSRARGNADLAVLRLDRQTPIHVTPLIDDFARGLFHEPLQVIGPPAKRFTANDMRRRQRGVRDHFVQMIGRFRAGDMRVRFPEDKQLDHEYWEAVVVGDATYRVSSFLVATGHGN